MHVLLKVVLHLILNPAERPKLRSEDPSSRDHHDIRCSLENLSLYFKNGPWFQEKLLTNSDLIVLHSREVNSGTTYI